MVFEMTNSNKSVFIDQNTSHIKHGWQAKRMIMEYNACVSCALIGHNFPTVVQIVLFDISDCACVTNLGGNMARFTQFPLMITRSTIIYEIISPGAAGSSIYV